MIMNFDTVSLMHLGQTEMRSEQPCVENISPFIHCPERKEDKNETFIMYLNHFYFTFIHIYQIHTPTN